MKKRVKLFTTIASLCLAVALMAFGVYAATTTTFNVTNTVTFKAGLNVNATINVGVAQENTATCTMTGATATAGTYSVDSTGAWTENKATHAVGDIVLTAKDSLANNADVSYSYVIKITDGGASDGKLQATFAWTPVTGVTVTVNDRNAVANADCATGTGTEFTVKVKIDDPLKSHATAQCNITITLTQVSAE